MEVIVISENEDSKYKDRAGLNTTLHFSLSHSADYFSPSLFLSFFLPNYAKKYSLTTEERSPSSKQMFSPNKRR